MRKSFWIILLVLLVATIAACQSNAPELPTPLALPTTTPLPPTDTATPSITPSLTLTPTATPSPTPGIVPATTSQDPTQQSFVRVIHAIPDTGAVDVYFELLSIARNLSYATNSPESPIVAGDYRVRVAPTGTNADENLLFEEMVTVAGGTSLILLLTEVNESIQLQVYTENLEPLAEGQSRVSVIHAAPDTPSIVLVDDGTIITASADYGQRTPFVQTSSGESVFVVQNGANALAEFPTELSQRTNYIFAVIGQPGALSVLTLESRVGGLVNVRTINASERAGNIDVYVDGESLFQNLGFSAISSRRSIAAQDYLIEMYPVGTDISAAEPLASTRANFVPGENITFFLVGVPGQSRIVIQRDDLSPTATGELRITFLNTMENNPNLSILNDNRLIEGLPNAVYGQPGVNLSLVSGSYRFSVETPNGIPLEVADNIQLAPGTSYLYLIRGRINDPLILPEVVGIDDTATSEVQLSAPEPEPQFPTQVRFVNAVYPPVDLNLAIDGMVIAESIPYENATDLLPVVSGLLPVELRSTTDGEVVFGGEITLPDEGVVSLFAYRTGGNSYGLLVVPDTQLELDGDEPLPSLRLVHVGENNLVLNLTQNPAAAIRNLPAGEAFPDYTFEITGAPSEPATPTGDGDGEIPFDNNRPAYRTSAPLDAQNVFPIDVQSPDYSGQVLIPAGLKDILIIDAEPQLLASIMRNVSLVPEQHYDIVAFKELDSNIVRGFVVTYTESSD